MSSPSGLEAGSGSSSCEDALTEALCPCLWCVENELCTSNWEDCQPPEDVPWTSIFSWTLLVLGVLLFSASALVRFGPQLFSKGHAYAQAATSEADSAQADAYD
jgi:hypothetical protein